jgi:hypothetical protein
MGTSWTVGHAFRDLELSLAARAAGKVEAENGTAARRVAAINQAKLTRGG